MITITEEGIVMTARQRPRSGISEFFSESKGQYLASNILKAATEDFDWIGNFLNIDPAYLF